MPSRFFLCAAVSVLIAGGCIPHGRVGEGPATRALEERVASFFAALDARDAVAAASHFADDAVLQVAGMPQVQGRDAILAFYGNVFRFLESSTATPEALRVSRGGDVGYGFGRVVNVFPGEDAPREYQGKFLLAWERRAGTWVISAYSVSSDQPQRD